MRWLPVTSHVGFYEVSDTGLIRSLPRVAMVAHPSGPYERKIKARILEPARDIKGRKRITLWRESVKRQQMVAVLVLEAFVGPRPAGFYGCHKDDDCANDELVNLYWGTPTMNSADKIRNGHQPYGMQCRSAKLTDDEVREIRMMRGKAPRFEIAAQFGLAKSTIDNVIDGRTWRHV